jgi:hypothetical protein
MPDSAGGARRRSRTVQPGTDVPLSEEQGGVVQQEVIEPGVTDAPVPQVRVQVESVRSALSGVEEQSVLIKQITDEVVGRYSRELDEFVTNIKGLLDRIRQGTVVNISDRQLELNTIKLPVLMYFAGNGLEQLGCEGDVAKARRLEEFNNILMRVDGTIPHRQAVAENSIFYQAMAETIYIRAYKQLKSKMDMADRLFSALKKVLSKRMLELELSGRELPNNPNSATEDENNAMEGERE